MMCIKITIFNIMRRKVFLLLAALMAVVAVNADDKWPITLTTADGLPGSQPLFDNTGMKPLKTAVEEIKRGLLTYDRPVEEVVVDVDEEV